MANLLQSQHAGLLAGRWCGFLSLTLGALAMLIFFVVRHWNFSALGESADEVISLAVTWLPVVLPIAGFGLGILGIARDQWNALAITATVVNVLGLIVAGMIIAILMG
jgi:hypothetical protein